jgi:hypothetical protein
MICKCAYPFHELALVYYDSFLNPFTSCTYNKYVVAIEIVSQTYLCVFAMVACIQILNINEVENWSTYN